MTIFYRLCGIASTNPSPIYQEDKYKLNELCLRSFREAFREVNPNVLFLADYCGEEYDEMIRRILPFKYDIFHSEIGINETCLLQYKMAHDIDDDFLFAECDYLWRPNTGQQLLEAIQRFELVSPYNHLNFYKDRSIHSNQVTLELYEDELYRTTERNTMTFGMTKEAFEQNKDILNKYGYLDNEVWREMRENYYPLWVPTYSIATHMAKDWLAPSVKWEALWKTLI